MDVTDEASVASSFGSLHGRVRHIDVLVNNAGVGGGEAVQGSDVARWKHTIDTNLTGMYLVTRQVLPLMPGEGRIINLSSVLGRFGVPGYTAYCASKHGVIGFTRALALELANRKITVNAICPGWVETDMAVDGMNQGAKATGTTYDEFRNMALGDVPQAHHPTRRSCGFGSIPRRARHQRRHRTDLQHLRRTNDGLNTRGAYGAYGASGAMSVPRPCLVREPAVPPSGVTTCFKLLIDYSNSFQMFRP